MKFVSWNVDGFKAILRHGFRETVTDLNPDIFCVQQTRLQPDEIEFELPGYHNTGTMLKEKGMRELRFLPRRSHRR